jgi:hypothetical protein
MEIPWPYIHKALVAFLELLPFPTTSPEDLIYALAMTFDLIFFILDSAILMVVGTAVFVGMIALPLPLLPLVVR